MSLSNGVTWFSAVLFVTMIKLVVKRIQDIQCTEKLICDHVNIENT